MEETAVVQRDRLRARVEALRQVEARHQFAVEVHRHTACVLHAHVQHRVVLQRRNAHLVTLLRLPITAAFTALHMESSKSTAFQSSLTTLALLNTFQSSWWIWNGR